MDRTIKEIDIWTIIHQINKENTKNKTSINIIITKVYSKLFFF